MEVALHYTALYTAYTVFTDFIGYTIQTALHFLNSSKYAYDKVSDVVESLVRFASKNLTPHRMH